MFNNWDGMAVQRIFLGNGTPKSPRIADTQNVFVFQENITI